MTKGLGKGLKELGLDVLLSGDWKDADAAAVSLVSLDQIDVDPLQPRQHWDEASLQRLTESVRRYGVLQPVLLHPMQDRYLLVAGERRYRAAKAAGLREIPACCRVLSEMDRRGIALIENIQRQDLSAIEQALALQRLIDEHQLTHQKLAELLSMSRAHISNLLRLLQLEPEVHTALRSSALDAGHARVLVGLSREKQLQWLERILQERLSVRAVEAALRTERVKVSSKIQSYAQGAYFCVRIPLDQGPRIERLKALLAEWET